MMPGESRPGLPRIRFFAGENLRRSRYPPDMKCASLLLLVASATLLPGCVFWEIRDGVRATNGRLDTVDASLGRTNERLDQVNTELRTLQNDLNRLDTTNEELVNVQDDLGRLDKTNQFLTNVQARLDTLNSINQSLHKMDVHLASLRKTIGRIDGMIPFMDLGTDEPVPESVLVDDAPRDAGAVTPDAAGNSDAAAAESAPAGASEPAAAAATETATAKPPVARDAVVGSWIRQFPDRSMAIVFQPDGRYVLQLMTPAGRVAEVGAWVREAKKITLNSDPADVTLPDGKTEQRTTTRAFEIVAQTTRSLTVSGSEQGLEIFSKP